MSASSKKLLRKEENAAILTEKQQKEQAEAKKLKVYSITFIAIVLVVAVTALSIMGVNLVSRSGIIQRNTIAATIGEHELNSVQFNYFFSDTLNKELSNLSATYGDSVNAYLGMMGLDITKPLDEQAHSSGEGTWADFFMETALAQAKDIYAFYDAAMAENFTLSEEEEEDIAFSVKELDILAPVYGYETGNDYLVAAYGHGSTLESYEEYTRINAIASAYYAKYSESLVYTDEDFREHEVEHYDDYTSFDFATYYVDPADFLEGGTKDEETGKVTYTDEEQQTAKDAAKETAESLLSATSVEELDKAIAALEINKEEEDPHCSVADNTFTPAIMPMIAEWLNDDSRKEGDITVLKQDETDEESPIVADGYYVVLFLSRSENLEPMANVRHLLVSFEGGTKDENGATTYTDAEKKAAKDEADKLLKQWEDGDATEDSFIELVKEHSDDSSAATGGLFEDIHPDSNYVPSFLNWSIDPDRKAGDTEVIESEFGYHVMFYSSDDEKSYRDYLIELDLYSADMDTWYNSITEDVTAELGNTSMLSTDRILNAN